jgi:hypothetical protein
MWQRFELFWTAFEKFALFFSFLGTLTGLIVIALIYRGVTEPGPAALPVPTPTPTPEPTPPIDQIVGAVLQGFEKIQESGETVSVPISYSVPIVLEVHIDPETARLEFVGKNKVKTTDIAIKFGDDVGWLIGNEALITFAEGEAIKVKLNLSDQIQFDVPIRHEVRVPITSGVDLSQEIDALEAISAPWRLVPILTPTEAAP